MAGRFQVLSRGDVTTTMGCGYITYEDCYLVKSTPVHEIKW